MTTSTQLQHWMRYEPRFVGVFPLDRIPHLRRGQHSLIVNTHSSNLPGEHWVAIRTMWDRAFVFDSLGSRLLPPSLCHHLLVYCNVAFVYLSDVCVQPANAITCGQHCVYFLYCMLPAPSEEALYDFIHELD